MSRESSKWLRFRLATLLCFFLILFVALISRAIQLQILSGKTLKKMADRQHIQPVLLQPERGIIFDRNGEKLAASVQVDSVCAEPSRIADPDAAARRLAPILKMDPEVIRRKIARRKHFAWIARRIPDSQADALEKLKIEGIYTVKESRRIYPNGELAAAVVGYVGIDADGLEGLEMRYNDDLKGTPEKLAWFRDAKGKKIFARVEGAEAAKTEDNYNLVLTIDSRIQYLVETKLREAVQAKGARGGFAMVMDPKTGEILAMANEPGFDPNKPKDTADKGRNRAITDVFDPGSTFKPFLAAAALEEKVVSESTRLNCENGAYKVNDRVFHEANRKKYGALTFGEVIKYSSNIGCVKTAERLGKDKFYNYITRFGFGARTGVDLPGESRGLLRPVRSWTRVDMSTVAFGQGISVTALQLITALSAIANDGVLMKPLIVRAVVDKQGKIIRGNTPTTVRRVISPETAKRLSRIMTSVVQDEDGTGKKARIANINVAGKTGTSQKFDPARRAYSSERVRTSFMGFFPAENPQITMMVVLDEPKIDKWGGVASAPVFSGIGEQILNCIKTDLRERTPAPPPREQELLTPDKGVKLVSAPALLLNGTRPDDEVNEALMPDFRGMTMREALKRAREKGIELNMSGNGWAVSQAPLPGTALKERRLCSVSFSTGQ
ncbi:MAG: penicillin-binding protein [Syntrophales bacterium]